ncbi:MAG: glycosyltransferase family 4 protein [Melioribacteraceae bacterium]|nr:glycosyltransferase family 4 protein [Melioribacteraceae bacterium]MCF8265853.1 glycosyltransferase family 4 protein [Melioribacteraceae bacterium]MCF8411794.1 glycosyltransferase family 4 protein [Melioribacteraceae bacterium]
MPKIIFDARKINDSGIGSIIKNCIPTISQKWKITLLGNQNKLNNWNFNNIEEIIEFDSKGYSLSEQFGYFSKIPACDLFISPHYNAPVFAPQIKRLISFVHDMYHLEKDSDFPAIKRMAASLLVKSAVRKSKKVVTISNFSKERIQHFTAVNDQKLVVNYCGVEKELFNKIFTSSESELVKAKYKLPEEYLLFIGNLKPNKNLKNLLLALLLILPENKNIKLVVVGKKDGFITGDNESLRILNANANLNNSVIFTGFVDDEDLPVIIQKASIMVFPSLYEGFGLPPLEAMCAGIPVASSDRASIPEVCKDAVLYFNPLNPEQIAANILTILNDKDLRNELIAKGNELVLEYTWAKFGNKLNSVIESVLAE